MPLTSPLKWKLFVIWVPNIQVILNAPEVRSCYCKPSKPIQVSKYNYKSINLSQLPHGDPHWWEMKKDISFVIWWDILARNHINAQKYKWQLKKHAKKSQVLITDLKSAHINTI